MKAWKKLYEVAGQFVCPYCLGFFPIEEATKDHKAPTSRQGKNTPDNIVAACAHCNSEKGSLTPEEYELWKMLEWLRLGKFKQKDV